MTSLFYRLGEVWRATRAWPCWRKQAYPDRASASLHMLMLAATGKTQPEKGRLNAFACPYCGHWHVGHTSWRVTNGILLEAEGDRHDRAQKP